MSVPFARNATPFARLTERRRRVRSLGAALLMSLAGIGLTARAALDPAPPLAMSAIETGATPADAPAPSLSAIAPGMTGTAALPAEPTGYVAAADPTLVAAPPFLFRGSALDHARALQCLTTAIYYEAAGEPDDGQAAVAQVILNRVRHPAFPGTVCGVIYQGSDRRGCQFSYACDGSMARRPSPGAWGRARGVAERALAGRVFAGVGFATHYHTHAVTPYWNKSLVMTGVYGAHFFHRWKGYWGTPAAFTATYRGGEPLPAPLPASAPALHAATGTPAAPPAPAGPALPVGDTASIQPAYREAGAIAANLPESAVLDKWKDSGKPLL